MSAICYRNVFQYSALQALFFLVPVVCQDFECDKAALLLHTVLSSTQKGNLGSIRGRRIFSQPHGEVFSVADLAEYLVSLHKDIVVSRGIEVIWIVMLKSFFLFLLLCLLLYFLLHLLLYLFNCLLLHLLLHRQDEGLSFPFQIT